MDQYWVYYNWRAERGEKAIVHRGDCGNCNNGQGKMGRGSSTPNGRWLGPFNTRQDEYRTAQNTGAARVDGGRCCSP